MSTFKKLLTVIPVLVVFAISMIAVGQQPAAAPTIQGKFGIQYNSRTQVDDQGNPQLGVKDIYKFEELRVADTIIFQGTIEHLPSVFSTTLGRERQASTLTYNMNLLVANPANLSQRRAVGKMTGGVLIDRKGVYNYDQGTLRIAIDATGKAAGFVSNFRGTAAGKPPKGGESLLSKVKKQAQTLTKQVKGKTVKLVVTDYDIMTLRNLTLAAGPSANYPETQVNGEMLYDYERSAWYFRGLTMSYLVDGKAVTDKVTGNIKWIESPQRKTNGEGEYQFDIRFNEPEQKGGEAAVFQAVDDEAAFFATDTTLPSLTGTAKYKDAFSGETVISSAVTIDLVGNNLNKQQVVNANKLVWFICVVPFNAE